jgi:DNA polymerase-3 subunit gamma/tau
VQARWKVYVVDECHMLSTAAFNALLKTLEEPPPQVVFVLATTDPQRVLSTILSRCQRFDFRRIPLEALKKHLHWIAQQESIVITPEALDLVAQRAQGGLRDAESLLDQLSLLPPPVEATAVWDLLGAVPEEELLHLVQAMAEGHPLGVVEGCRHLLERGREPNAVLQGLAALLRDLLLAGVAPDRLELTSVSPALRPDLPPLAKTIGKERLLRWHASLKGSEQQLRHSVQPRLWLEVLLLGLLAEPTIFPATKERESKGSAQAPGGESRSAAPEQQSKDTPASDPSEPLQAPFADSSLADTWQQILSGLQLPSTRMLLCQQASLHQLDDRRAVVRVASNWITMVQSRLPLLEKAIEATLGSPRQITLEATDHQERPAPMEAPTASIIQAPLASAGNNPVHPEPTQAKAMTGITPQVPETSQEDQSDRSAKKEVQAENPVQAEQNPTEKRPVERMLDDSTNLLADFFNGQVITSDPQEES